MNKRTLLTCLLFVLAPAAAAAVGPQPMTLEELTAEVKSLRRLVNELIAARQADSVRRCEAEREESGPAEASIAQLEQSLSRIAERCEHEREVLGALTRPR